MFKKLSEIAEHLGGTLEGEDISVNGISGSDDAIESYLTFMESEKYRSSVEASRAAAVGLIEKGINHIDYYLKDGMFISEFNLKVDKVDYERPDYAGRIVFDLRH